MRLDDFPTKPSEAILVNSPDGIGWAYRSMTPGLQWPIHVQRERGAGMYAPNELQPVEAPDADKKTS